MNEDPIDAQQVHQLASAGDWAALVRYSMAHGCDSAMAAALDVVRSKAPPGDGGWKRLVQTITLAEAGVFGSRLKPAFKNLPPLTQSQRVTLQMLPLYGGAILCELARTHEPWITHPLLENAVRDVTEASRIADRVHDETLKAFFLRILGHGERRLGNAELAVRAYEQSLAIYHRLAEQEPDLHLRNVAGLLRHVSTFSLELARREKAVAYGLEAVPLYRRLARDRGGKYLVQASTNLTHLGALTPRRDVARLYFEEASQNLRRFESECPLAAVTDRETAGQLLILLSQVAEFHRDSHDWEQAKTAYEKLVQVCGQNRQERPTARLRFLAKAENGLASVFVHFGQWKLAEPHLAEALHTYRLLAKEEPDEHLAALATVACNLGLARVRSEQWQTAQTSYRESLEIFNGLAETARAEHLGTIGKAHLGLACAQSHLRDWEPSRASAERARETFMAWAKTSPTEALPNAATAAFDVGIAERQLGRLQEARRAFKDAYDIYRGCDQGDVESHRSNVLQVLIELCNLERYLNNYAAALEAGNQGLALCSGTGRGAAQKPPPEQAFLWFNLGLVLQEMGDIPAALANFHSALATIQENPTESPEEQRRLIAEILGGIAWNQSVTGDLEAAVKTGQQAIAEYRNFTNGSPERRLHLARELSALGDIRRRMGDLGGARKDLTEALEITREATASSADGRTALAQALNNLAICLRHLGERVAALGYYEEAAAIYEEDAKEQPNAWLQERLFCYMNTAILLRESPSAGLSERQRARGLLRKARDLGERLRGRYSGQEYRNHVQKFAAQVYELLAITCIELADVSGTSGNVDTEALWEAVEAAEAGRSRQLIDMLADEVLNPANTPAEVKADLRAVRQEIRRVQQKMHMDGERRMGVRLSSMGPADGGFRTPALLSEPTAPRAAAASEIEATQRRLRELTTEQRGLLDRIRLQHDPTFEPDRPVPPVRSAEIRSLLVTQPDTALIQYTITLQAAFAIVITHDRLLPVPLPGLNKQVLGGMASRWFREYHGRGPLAASNRQTASDNQDRVVSTWENALPGLLEPVAALAVRPVIETLTGLGIHRLVLSLNGALHVYPLHACTLADGRYLSDEFQVVYTPSLSPLHRCHSSPREKPNSLLLVQNPTGDLPFSDVEGASTEKRFQPHVRSFHQGHVSKEDLFREAQQRHVWHFSGHAFFDWQAPLDSALVLTDTNQAFSEHWLTLREIFAEPLNLRRASLAILSGCESGMVWPEETDDYVNLTTGFLYAGATCVICTLWAVNDLSSALLMDKFHGLWRDETGAQVRTPAAALCEAQKWLRDGIRDGKQLRSEILPALLARLEDPGMREICDKVGRDLEMRYPSTPPFASPVHWAAFVCVGLGYALPQG